MPHPDTIDSLFRSIDDTFDNSFKDIKSAEESANRISNEVKKLVKSFDEHDVRTRKH
jgi:archaellum component FlaC